MRQLAVALAIAVSYLDTRSDDSTEDDDVSALEAVSAELFGASTEEKRAMIAALAGIDRVDLVNSLGLE